MSVDSQSLQRKDRAELATIAEALGGKTTSRTKKADMVQMIMELSGNESGAKPAAARSAGAAGAEGLSSRAADSDSGDSGTPSGGSGESPKADAAATAENPNGDNGGVSGRESSAAKPDAGSGADRSDSAPGESSTDKSSDPEESSPDTSTGSDSQPESSDAEKKSGGGGDGRDRSGGDQGGRNQGGGGQGGDGQGGRNRNQNQNRNRNKGGNQQQKNQQQGNQQQGNQQQDQGDSGNRRRRRRGRGRDRQESNEPEVAWEGEPIAVSGLLDLRDEGYGFLRVKGFLPSEDDVYVPVKFVRQQGLRKGDHLEGAYRPANKQEKNPAMVRVDKVNGQDPESQRKRPRFEDLTPLFPDSQLRLEQTEKPLDMTSRIIDLISPIGKGQRGLIVSPPKAGKTTVLKTVAQSIEANNPDVHLMVLLVDERPEEVTDMRRSVSGEVIASTFDRPSDEHTQVAELAIERAKRLVEAGTDVVVVLDGITRLSRAYNLAAPATGRIMSGGIDTGALYPPKRFFGAARNVEEGGSLTILATALVETGSKMDEVIFEEFKGTGNMELRLDRKASEKRIYPAIDVDASSTRHEELLFERTQLQQVWKLRRVLSGLAAEGSAGAGLELLIDRMKTFPSNDEFLAEIAKTPSVSG